VTSVVKRVEGLRELQNALRELPKATGNNVLRRALIKAAEPIEAAMEARAPYLSGRLKASVMTGTRLSARQAKEHKAAVGTLPMVTVGGFRSNPAKGVFVFVGPGPLRQAITQEFGTSHNAPQAFARPAWDGNKDRALSSIKDDLTEEIEKARARLARKAEREAMKLKAGR